MNEVRDNRNLQTSGWSLINTLMDFGAKTILYFIALMENLFFTFFESSHILTYNDRKEFL